VETDGSDLVIEMSAMQPDQARLLDGARQSTTLAPDRLP